MEFVQKCCRTSAVYQNMSTYFSHIFKPFLKPSHLLMRRKVCVFFLQKLDNIYVYLELDTFIIISTSTNKKAFEHVKPMTIHYDDNNDGKNWHFMSNTCTSIHIAQWYIVQQWLHNSIANESSKEGGNCVFTYFQWVNTCYLPCDFTPVTFMN